MQLFRTLLLICLIAACPAVAAAAPEQGTDSSRIMRLPSGEVLKKYYFVLLTKGPRRGEITDTAAINVIQKGHMDNMDRLAKMGKLVVAGPFADNGNWRGIFIFDCNTEEEVKQLLATDPAIAAGRLSYEMHPWWTAQGTVFK